MKNIPTFHQYLQEKEIYGKKGNMKSSEVNKVIKELNRLFKDLSVEFNYQPEGLIKLSKGTGNVEADAYLQGIRGDDNKNILKEKNLFVSNPIGEYFIFILYDPDVEVKRQEFNLLDSDMSPVYYIENNLSDVYAFIENVYDKVKQKEILKDLEKNYVFEIVNAYLDEYGRVCANHVNLSNLDLIKLPFIFGKIKGDFYCMGNQLESLEGAPEIVEGDFVCKNNKIKSLEWSPKEIGGNFDCSSNYIKSLEGCPEKINSMEVNFNSLTDLRGLAKEITGNFYCENNKLSSLRGCPKKIGGDFSIISNELKSLVGAPAEVGGSFLCGSNELKSLNGCPAEVGESFDCKLNKLENLRGCPKKVGGDFDCSMNELVSFEGCPEEIKKKFNCSLNDLESFEFCPKEIGGDFICTSNQFKNLDNLPKFVGGNFSINNNQNHYFAYTEISKVCWVKGKINT